MKLITKVMILGLLAGSFSHNLFSGDGPDLNLELQVLRIMFKKCDASREKSGEEAKDVFTFRCSDLQARIEELHKKRADSINNLMNVAEEFYNL